MSSKAGKDTCCLPETLTAERQRRLLLDLALYLDRFGITHEIHQPDSTLEPWLDVRYGNVHTYVEIRTGHYIAFSGMPQAPMNDPSSAARSIASLCGIPGIRASGPT